MTSLNDIISIHESLHYEITFKDQNVHYTSKW